MTTPMQSFFQSYERHSTEENLSELASNFAETFLAAGPQGAKCVSAAVFAPALAQRKQLFDRLGCRRPELVSVTETPLDSRYVLARTQWRFTFEPSQAQPVTIPVESTFLLDTAAKPFRILVYLAHQDILTILRDRGLIEPNPNPVQ